MHVQEVEDFQLTFTTAEAKLFTEVLSLYARTAGITGCPRMITRREVVHMIGRVVFLQLNLSGMERP